MIYLHFVDEETEAQIATKSLVLLGFGLREPDPRVYGVNQ